MQGPYHDFQRSPAPSFSRHMAQRQLQQSIQLLHPSLQMQKDQRVQKLLICDQKCASCHKCNQVCDRFEKEACRHLDKAPFVCNGCSKVRNLCSIPTKYSYDAHFAQRKYEELLTSSREGIAKSRAEIHRINSIAHPLIMQGQSPYVILTNHPELDMSVRTMYKSHRHRRSNHEEHRSQTESKVQDPQGS